MSARVYWFLSSFACRQRRGVARPQTHPPIPSLRHHRVVPSHAHVYATTHTGTRHSQHLLSSTPHITRVPDMTERVRAYTFIVRDTVHHSASPVSSRVHTHIEPTVTLPLYPLESQLTRSYLRHLSQSQSWHTCRRTIRWAVQQNPRVAVSHPVVCTPVVRYRQTANQSPTRCWHHVAFNCPIVRDRQVAIFRTHILLGKEVTPSVR
jgi:hypothetical protein